MNRLYFFAGVFGVALLAACGGGGSSVGSYAPAQTFQQSVAVDPAATSTPVIIYVGFTHPALKTSTYGPVAYYSKLADKGDTEILHVVTGHKVVFENDDTTNHTASGLGKSGFPAEFDNKSGINAVGTQINGNLTWATGTLSPHAKSKPFTVGPVGTYYFGCYYHYHVTPNMRDVFVVGTPSP